MFRNKPIAKSVLVVSPDDKDQHVIYKDPVLFVIIVIEEAFVYPWRLSTAARIKKEVDKSVAAHSHNVFLHWISRLAN